MSIVITILACITITVFLIALWFFKFLVKKPPFIVDIKIPEKVSVNELFDVVFIVRNLGERFKILESVDIYKTFISNFTLESMSPNVKANRELINFISFDVNIKLLPQQAEKVILKLRAVKSGSFIGTVMVITPQNEITQASVGVFVQN